MPFSLGHRPQLPQRGTCRSRRSRHAQTKRTSARTYKTADESPQRSPASTAHRQRRDHRRRRTQPHSRHAGQQQQHVRIHHAQHQQHGPPQRAMAAHHRSPAWRSSRRISTRSCSAAHSAISATIRRANRGSRHSCTPADRRATLARCAADNRTAPSLSDELESGTGQIGSRAIRDTGSPSTRAICLEVHLLPFQVSVRPRRDSGRGLFAAIPSRHVTLLNDERPAVPRSKDDGRVSHLAATNRPHMTPSGATNRCASPSRQRPSTLGPEHRSATGGVDDQPGEMARPSMKEGTGQSALRLSVARTEAVSQPERRPAPARPERRQIAPDKPGKITNDPAEIVNTNRPNNRQRSRRTQPTARTTPTQNRAKTRC